MQTRQGFTHHFKSYTSTHDVISGKEFFLIEIYIHLNTAVYLYM